MKVEEVDFENFYCRATAPTTIRGATPKERDDVEFKLDPIDHLVFYRSASRESVFFFPPQNLYSVPLSDAGSNKARLEDLRKKLKWDSLAVLEDFEDGDLDDPNNYQSLDLSQKNRIRS